MNEGEKEGENARSLLQKREQNRQRERERIEIRMNEDDGETLGGTAKPLNGELGFKGGLTKLPFYHSTDFAAKEKGFC